MKTPLIVAAAVLLASSGGANAALACAAPSPQASGAHVLPLVELYTSEGCDSCPPADKWLSSTFPAGSATASVLAFHVDYWDRLGWKDRFASADYTARQQAASRTNGASFVYTPQVLVQGRDVDRSKRIAAVDAARARPARATISLDPQGNAVVVRAAVPETGARRTAAVWLAYTEDGLVSDVNAGENRGATLRHDHVVRALYGPFAVDAAGNASATVDVEPPKERGSRASLVAFVQDRASGEVLQTLTLRCAP